MVIEPYPNNFINENYFHTEIRKVIKAAWAWLSNGLWVEYLATSFLCRKFTFNLNFLLCKLCVYFVHIAILSLAVQNFGKDINKDSIDEKLYFVTFYGWGLLFANCFLYYTDRGTAEETNKKRFFDSHWVVFYVSKSTVVAFVKNQFVA